MFHLKDISRQKAFFYHLGVSLVIFLIVLYFIVFEWYPQPFFSTDGGWQGVRLIAAVDIILGPVLTLIIFNPKKPELKTDVSIIAAIQFIALFSGLYVVHNERPVAKIFQDGNFYIVTGYDMAERKLSLDELEKYRVGDAVTIYLDLPDDHAEFEKLQHKAVQKREVLFLNTALYKKIDDDIIKKMRLFSIDIERFINDVYSEKELKIFHAFLKKHNAKVDDFLYLGLNSRYKHVVTAFDPETLKFVGVIPVIYKPQVDVFPKYIKYDIYRMESYKEHFLKNESKK
ncbi:hypothetical protein MNBD_GAMMA23-1401 [hydrothermal vent metagenome]|uniref:Type IV pilin accessory protein n=1 Tax=hydrothermal vent metagenome TaxID=652676 RepID=A0A3B1AAU4_9ZZZZ